MANDGIQSLIFIFGVIVIGYVLYTSSKPEEDQKDYTGANIPASHSRKFDPSSELPKDLPESEQPELPNTPEPKRPDPPKPEKVHFPTSGETFMMFKELGCKEDENSIMTGSNTEICQVMCASDNQCGRFTINDDGDCKMYNICTPVHMGENISLYTRHKK